ncbi:MAG: hypothetical protein GXP10_07770 [Gammaproteobacteria bacterium]|nr:hypothetical protein [Gammaproteobacteria bacterium]
MNIRAVTIWLFAIIITLALLACSDTMQVADEGGIGGTGIVSSGPVSGFGSVHVNGIRFDTSAAQITVGGMDATEDALQLGMVVTVVGEINAALTQGRADTVTFNYLLQAAEVSNIDQQEGTITAAGKTIRVDELTVFINRSMATLVVGDTINVSGNSRASGEIVATHIAAVAGLGPATTPVIDNTNALEEQILGVTDQLGVERVILSGLITSQLAGSRIVVQGVAVGFDADTLITNGTESDLNVDTGVNIKARLNASGELSAEQITIQRRANVYIEAAIDAIDADSASVTLAGIATTVTADTLMQDSSSVNLRRFSLSDLGISDNLTVYGRREGETITLSRLQRRDTLATTTLSGPIGSVISNPTFELLGLVVDATNVATENGYTDADGNSTSADAFFAQLSEGALVRVSGTLNGSTLIADSATIVVQE